jgi:transcription factor WhiB
MRSSPPATSSPPRPEFWWQIAACAGLDPEWWSDDRSMRPVAVEICLRCPVREPCLNEAVRDGDCGVVRGAMLLVKTRRGSSAVSLVCSICRVRPVIMTPTGHTLYCGLDCAARAAKGDRMPTYVRRAAARVRGQVANR